MQLDKSNKATSIFDLRSKLVYILSPFADLIEVSFIDTSRDANVTECLPDIRGTFNEFRKERYFIRFFRRNSLEIEKKIIQNCCLIKKNMTKTKEIASNLF